ncbi:putative protein heading date repressor 1 [Helianthus annuus]|uniref:Uncharacterized protein n=1 Tax=Helianthus annuus TaxID=4232 RepID=A0A9K3N217_HELAN|nr:putative protein heading date repressor 1 [Helianthus annuus]KAJ0519244.1 putative protein heading date repressor 1 [Helianthus annuus]KAJ0691034.1 putative protein heading date repressor 1 [Helianthus annuus]
MEEDNKVVVNGFSPVTSTPVFWKSRKRSEIDGLNEQLEEDSRVLEHLQLQLLDERSKRADVERQNALLQNQVDMLMNMLQEPPENIEEDELPQVYICYLFVCLFGIWRATKIFIDIAPNVSNYMYNLFFYICIKSTASINIC